MGKHLVTILNDDIKLEVEDGKNLLAAIQEAKLELDAPCGGQGKCEKCKVLINGEEVLACQTEVTGDILVKLPEKAENTILTEGLVATTQADGKNKYALAFDIGTTTVVAYLMDGVTGEQITNASLLNPQTTYGGDVIARVQYQITHPESTELRDCIRTAMESLAKEAAGKAGIKVEEITLVTMVGNTAMHHLMMGINPKSLTTPPYMPEVYEKMSLPLHDVLPIFPEGEFRALPNVAGFVGADTVGCMLSTRFDKKEIVTLMIDIGTNGEMVIGNKDRRICCSTAAGPAFEGARISQGMRGATGAIDHAHWEKDHLEYHVIGDGEAVGICGSGVLDVIAALLNAGIISWRGRLQTETSYSYTDESGVERQMNYFQIPGTNVRITQQDVREIQLAKSAIRSGIDLLIKSLKKKTDEVEEVLLAGAFGNYMSPEAACRIGMIPPALLLKIKSIGNAAGEGSKLAAVNEEEFEYAGRLHEGVEFLELASLPEFMTKYGENLNFPRSMEVEETEDE